MAGPVMLVILDGFGIGDASAFAAWLDWTTTLTVLW